MIAEGSASAASRRAPPGGLSRDSGQPLDGKTGRLLLLMMIGLVSPSIRSLCLRRRCLLSGTAMASDTNVVYAKRSSCTLVTVGSVSSILTTRFLTTRRSRRTGWTVFRDSHILRHIFERVVMAAMAMASSKAKGLRCTRASWRLTRALSSDPQSAWTAKANKRVQFGYS